MLHTARVLKAGRKAGLMNTYLLMKAAHILSSAILFGAGIGTAFSMLRAHFSGTIPEKYYAARTAVLASFILILPAIIAQPASGLWLLWNANYNWKDLWLAMSYILYIAAVIFWVRTVRIQIRIEKILAQCVKSESELPERYFRQFSNWFFLGCPVVGCLIAIFFLMVLRPN